MALDLAFRSILLRIVTIVYLQGPEFRVPPLI